MQNSIFVNMANYRFFIDYILHYCSAKTRHGVHSPFVYRLVDEVIYNVEKKPYTDKIEDQRSRLLNDPREITVTDLGAGSTLNNKRKKPIKTIAKNALKTKRVAQLLARLANHFSPEHIIELGTCLGITTAYLAEACPKAQVITVEGCPETAKVAISSLNQIGIGNVKVKTGNFDQVFPDILAAQRQVDFVFIDGNHRKEATLNYFRSCLPKIHDHSVLIFDDIYWSEGMKEAWQTIKDHPQVSLTIDLFFIGLVFFKRDQAKEHFKIRY